MKENKISEPKKDFIEEIESPKEEIIHKKTLLKKIKAFTFSRNFLIIIWIIGGISCFLDWILGLSTIGAYLPTGLSEKPYMLISTPISFTFLLVAFIVFLITFIYLIKKVFSTKDYVLKQTYSAFSLLIICEFLIHFIFYFGAFWDLSIGSTRFILFLHLYSIYILQIAKLIFIFYLIDKFVWFDQSKYIGIFFIFFLLPLIYLRNLIIHPEYALSDHIFGLTVISSILLIIFIRSKRKKMTFRFAVSQLNLMLILMLIFLMFFNYHAGAIFGSNIFMYFIPFQYIIVSFYYIALYKKTKGPIAKDSLKILGVMIILFFETYVLTGFIVFIPDQLTIYLAPLLAITGAVFIAQSKKIFYTLCNTLSEEKICIVHKGSITEKIYICPKCSTNYCNRCYSAIKENKDHCWYCNKELI